MATTYPTTVDTATQLYTAVNGINTTLNGSIDNAVTTLTVVDTTNFPSVGYIVIETEIIKYTGKTGTTFTGCTRGSDGSAAASHATAITVNAYIVADHHNVLMNAIIAIEADISARLGIGASSNAIVIPTGVSFAVGVGSTGTNNALAILNGGSGSSAGPILRFSRNSVQKGAIGTYGAIFGGASDNLAIYSPSNSVVIDCAGTDIVTIAATGVTISGANVGAAILVTLANTDNTNTASHAELFLQAGGTAGGDAYIRFNVPATTNWAMGLANAASDNFKISNGDQIGTGTDCFVITKTTLAVSIRGTNTNDSASAAFVGEYIEGLVSSPTNVPAATTIVGDLTSISLTAGDWDVSATVLLNDNAGSTATFLDAGIGTASGTGTTGMLPGINNLRCAGTNAAGISVSIPPYRVSQAGTNTYYFKAAVTYTGGTPQYRCRLSARRVR